MLPMPVYNFTFHAYRSWHEDDERGYVQRGESGVHAPNPELAAFRDYIADQSEVRFTVEQMNVLLDAFESTCRRKGWRPYGAAAACAHLHGVASWTGPLTPKRIRDGLKSGIGYCLSQQIGTTGHRWFSRGCEPTRVEDHSHLYYLLHEYFPKHAKDEGGICHIYKLEDEGES